MIQDKPNQTNLTWEIAELFPPQVFWHEGDYFLLQGFTVDVTAVFSKADVSSAHNS